MIRVSATMLESFRRVLTTEYATEEELIAQVKGAPFKPTWQMMAGSAWQLALSDPEAGQWHTDDEGEYVEFEEYGTTFSREDVEFGRAHVGPGLCEVKAGRDLFIQGESVRLVAQVDHINGTHIQENKAKFAPPDVSDYEPSLQWRTYLFVHDAESVRYNLFTFSERYGCCKLRGEVISATFWRYPGLKNDVRVKVQEFIAWAASRGLLDYLRRPGSTPEAP